MPVALSIRQPWLELILQGLKTIEVRSWQTTHRGELWLHAGAQPDKKALIRFGLEGDHRLTFGALVGKCELYDCVKFTDDSWHRWQSQHLNESFLEKPHYAWLLRKPIRVNPVPMKGRLGLMRIEN